MKKNLALNLCINCGNELGLALTCLLAALHLCLWLIWWTHGVFCFYLYRGLRPSRGSTTCGPRVEGPGGTGAAAPPFGAMSSPSPAPHQLTRSKVGQGAPAPRVLVRVLGVREGPVGLGGGHRGSWGTGPSDPLVPWRHPSALETF